MGYEMFSMGEAFPVHANRWTKTLEDCYRWLTRGITEAEYMVEIADLFESGFSNKDKKIGQEVMKKLVNYTNFLWGEKERGHFPFKCPNIYEWREDNKPVTFEVISWGEEYTVNPGRDDMKDWLKFRCGNDYKHVKSEFEDILSKTPEAQEYLHYFENGLEKLYPMLEKLKNSSLFEYLNANRYCRL